MTNVYLVSLSNDATGPDYDGKIQLCERPLDGSDYANWPDYSQVSIEQHIEKMSDFIDSNRFLVGI